MIDLLKEFCSIPTAPFAEQRVIEFVRDFVRRRPGLTLQTDAAGYVLVSLLGRRPRLPRWILAAHMDHPGALASRMLDDQTLLAEFHGGVRASFLADQRLRFFTPQGPVVGRVLEVDASRDGWPKRLRLRVRQRVAAGSLGMLDLGEGRVRGHQFICRACDDLAGGAAALAALDLLRQSRPLSTVAVLLTRAEEVGFVGAMAAVQRPKLLRKSDRIIAIECSAEQPVARQGDGPIIRVGDRTSIFNSALTWYMTEQAQSLAKRRPGFRFQRALMPGGTCEATVYDAWDHLAGSVCVALRNYHNMNQRSGRLAAENVDVRDWQNMVHLFVQLARHGHGFTGDLSALRRWLTSRYQRYQQRL